MENIALSIIIPTFNRAAALLRCLRALECQDCGTQAFEVIVIDDGSTGDSLDKLKETTFSLNTRILSQSHAGASTARNYGAKCAQGELLLFLGDDMVAQKDVVSSHLRAHALRSAENVGVIGCIQWAEHLLQTPFLRYLSEPDCPYQFCFTGFDSEDVPIGRMYSSHLSMKRRFFDQHGGFDETFALPAFDDVELEFRLRKSGFRLVYEPAAQVFHSHFYNLASFCDRMKIVGRAAVHLFRKHPQSITLTDIGTLLTLPVYATMLERKIERLAQKEAQLKGMAKKSDAAVGMYNQLCQEWPIVLSEAAALGVQEALREGEWDQFRSLSSMSGHSAETLVPKLLTATLGTVFREQGTEVVRVNDSCFSAQNIGGKDCVCVTPNSGGLAYLYFRLAPSISDHAAGPISVTVEYLNPGEGSWRLEYDSSDLEVQAVPHLPGAFKATPSAKKRTPSGIWHKATFHLDDWLFLGRCNGGDFRIAAEADANGFCVSKVQVRFQSSSPKAGECRLKNASACSEGATLLDPVSFEEDVAPEVSIIIPVYGQVEYTAACLYAIRASTENGYEVIVVDNGSTDGTSEFLSRCKGIRTIALSQNRGFAIACNLGAEVAKSNSLVFLNNDTVALPGWLTALRMTLAQHPEAGIVGAKLLYPNRGGIQHAGVDFSDEQAPYHVYRNYPAHHPLVSRTRPVAAVTGACILISKRDFLQAGGFDKRFLNGFEDVDLCLKLAARGRKSYYCATSVLYHCESTTPGRHDREMENFKLFNQIWQSKLPTLLNYGHVPTTTPSS